MLSQLKRRPVWVLLGLTLLLVVTVRLRLLSMPLERDEGEYAFAGQLILQGVPPYQEIYNMKLPGTYAAYAVILALFGQSPAGIHFGVLLVNVASVLLVFLLGRQLLDDAAGLAAAACFALLSLSPSILGLAGHATHFVVLAALAGTWLLLEALQANPLFKQKQTKGTKGPAEPGSRIAGDEMSVSAGFAASSPQPSPPEEQTEDGLSQPGSRSQGVNSSAGTRVKAGLLLSPLRSLRLLLCHPWASFLVAGFVLGLAFVMKQHGIFFCLFGFAFLLWARLEESFIARAVARDPFSHPRKRKSGRPHKAEFASPRSEPGRRSLMFSTGGKVESEDGGDGNEAAAAKLEDGSSQRGEPHSPALGSGSGTQIRSARRADPTWPDSPGPGSGSGTAPPKQTDVEQLSTLSSQLRLRPRAGAPAPLPEIPDVPWARIFRELALFTAGLALPYVLTCFILWCAGVFPQFFFWTASYASQYASEIPARFATTVLLASLKSVLGFDALLWLLPWAGALMLWWDERLVGAHPPASHSENGDAVERVPTCGIRFLLTALLLCSLAALSVGFYFREHYFILLLPAVALLSGVAVSRSLHALKHERGLELFVAVPVLLLAGLAAAAAIIGNGTLWFATSPAQVTRRIYGTPLFAEAAKIGEYVRAHSAKDARIAVIGSEPEIYFHAHRHSATGYIYTYPLVENQDFARTMQDNMIAEIERARPEYVVVVDDELSWIPSPSYMARPYTQSKIYGWWQPYWNANLELVKTVEVEWDRERLLAVGQTEAVSSGPKKLLLLKRRDAAGTRKTNAERVARP